MSVLLGRDVPELVKIGPTVQGLKKSLVMATTTRAQAKRRTEEDERTEQKEKQSGAKATPVVEQVDSDVAMESRVQLKNSLENAAVQHKAEGLKAPEKRSTSMQRGRSCSTWKRSRDCSVKTLLCSRCGKRQKESARR